MKRYIEEYYKRRGENQVFKIKVRDDAPIQENGVDCGVFVCRNAEKIARKVHVNTRQDEMADARKQMMIELYHRKLIESKDAKPEGLSDMIPSTIMRGTMTRKDKICQIEDKKVSRKDKRYNKDGKKSDLNVTKTCSKNRGKAHETKLQSPKCNTREASGKGDTARRQPIDWPKANNPEWSRLDDDVSKRLRIIVGSREQRLRNYIKPYSQQQKKIRRRKGTAKRQVEKSEIKEEGGNLKKEQKKI